VIGQFFSTVSDEILSMAPANAPLPRGTPDGPHDKRSQRRYR
jgi:hypothetical protein